MTSRITRGILTFAAAALVAAPLGAWTPASAQEVSSRFKVVVPYFQPLDGANRRFGEDVAKELRDLLDDLVTHRATDEDDIEDAADRFRIDHEELTCITTRQLTSQTNLGEVIYCGTYAPRGGQYVVDAEIIVVSDGTTLDVDPVTVREGDDRAAAQQLFDAFGRFVTLDRVSRFCGEYYQSRQFENALENCNRAIELNPEGTTPIFTRALIYKELERFDEALVDVQRVLEIDPVHENALQWAGWLSAKLEMEDQARSYYNEYLELNPGDANVRMRVAYDLAQAGDPLGALMLIEQGIQLDPENPRLWEQLGNFAFSAASEIQSAAGQQELTAEAGELYQQGLQAYDRVLASGDTTIVLQPNQLRAMISAYIQMGILADAVETARAALEEHPGEAGLWAIYADALQRGGDMAGAIEALDRVREIDPEYPNVAIRQGRWLLDQGDMAAALPYLRRAVERGENSADQVAQILLAYGHSQGVRPNRFGLAIDAFQAAKQFEISGEMRSQIDFWHGFSVYKLAEAAQQPQTLETARRTLPMFQQARQLFQASRGYANSRPEINLGQFLNAVDTFIEIQEAIIRRGR